MTHKTFSVRMPIHLCERLEAEAVTDSRNRNQMLIKILKERYHLYAPPPTASPQSQPQPANASRASRKNNTIN